MPIDEETRKLLARISRDLDVSKIQILNAYESGNLESFDTFVDDHAKRLKKQARQLQKILKLGKVRRPPKASTSTSEGPDTSGPPGPSHEPPRTLKINLVNNRVDYGNDPNWSFRFEEVVQWESETGPFSILLDGFDELPSPFVDQNGKPLRRINSKQSSTQGDAKIWRAGPVEFARTWTPAQIRAARASDDYYHYIVAASEKGEEGEIRVEIDRSQNGRPDC